MTGAERVAVVAAGLLGAAGVALAAVEAHVGGLDGAHAAMLRRGVQIELFGAVALLGVAPLAREGGRLATLAIAGFVAGTTCFCAAVDLAAFGERAIVALAPLGGTTLIVAWLLVAVLGLRGGK